MYKTTCRCKKDEDGKMAPRLLDISYLPNQKSQRAEYLYIATSGMSGRDVPISISIPYTLRERFGQPPSARWMGVEVD